MTRVSIFIVFIFLISSCQKESKEIQAGSTLSENELENIKQNFCSTVDLADFNDRTIVNESNGPELRAAGAKGKFWPSGQVLKVRFMNGSTSLQNKVLLYAKQWEYYANITFLKVTSGNSDIRVLFGDQGHNSYVGLDNKYIAQSLQTMNLQLTDKSDELSIKRASLHEFGHALGLMHEHQQPFANIPWNKPKVYEYYAATEGWPKEKVDAQVLNSVGWGPEQHTSFDPKSIMEYAIPASLTTNGFSIPWNTDLSVLDKDFIGKIYSTNKIQLRHAANISGTITVNLNGVYSTLKKNEVLNLPANIRENTLNLWECPSSCLWSSYGLTLGRRYKIVSASSTNPNDLNIVLE